MESFNVHSVTRLLEDVGNGDEDAQSRLWRLLYDDLRNVAGRQLAHGDKSRIGTTSLVHETFIRLTGGSDIKFVNRRHFFASAARAMRQIRVDNARIRSRLKRGGGRPPESLLEDPVVDDGDPDEILAVHEAVDRLEKLDSRKAEVVILRFFAGLNVHETADAMGVSARTVDADWKFARAWLHRELNPDDVTT